MRTIKFRGKDIVTGELVYGNLFQGKRQGENYAVILMDKRYIHEEKLPEDIPFGFYKDEIFVVDPKTVGQFVGLFDCDKREIYEGDIIKTYVCFLDENGETREFWRVGVVKFISGKYQLTNCVNYYDEAAEIELELQPNPKMEYSFSAYRSKIIGNIHDNPELQEGGAL